MPISAAEGTDLKKKIARKVFLPYSNWLTGVISGEWDDGMMEKRWSFRFVQLSGVTFTVKYIYFLPPLEGTVPVT